MNPEHLLIDGYNLLGKVKGVLGRSDQSLEQEREAMIIRLGLYARRIGCAVTIVFDAWKQQAQVRQVMHRTGVTVMYSETGEKADQVIQQLARSGGKGLAVVSSDHEVLAVARAHGAFTMRSEEFAQRLRDPSRSGRAPSVRGSAQDKDEAEPVRSKEKKGNPRRLPKKVRQRNRIMRRF
ncbi:MAG: NYN domain-containing protein [Nitrospirales bacterium]|nr:NYN domain-containing protein [Nitrospirales bacterium]